MALHQKCTHRIRGWICHDARTRAHTRKHACARTHAHARTNKRALAHTHAHKRARGWVGVAGTFTYADGSVYEGDFEDGKKTGQGGRGGADYGVAE